MGRFEDEYNRLNKQQKAAVDYIDGPLLVVAGPGTGKTQLLSVRVANILKQRDINPSNILCLTFTNKAATNMQERLQTIIGNAAYEVNIKTFHSFAAEVMNHYPQYFWSGARLAIAPDAVQLFTIDSILRRLPHSNPLSVRFAGKHTNTERVKEAIKLAKEAGLDPAKLRAIITFNLAYLDEIEPTFTDLLSQPLRYNKLADLLAQVEQLPEHNVDAELSPLLSMSTVLREGLAFAVNQDDGTNKTKHVGDWKKQWVQKEGAERGMLRERRRNEWWLHLADVYESYQEKLHERGYYDYADMILEVIKQTEKHSALRASLQEKFQYLLIDEFQDTNAAQLRLAQLVAYHEDTPRPNLMAVGDDDQSIFKFNGAELNNMLYFQRTFEGTKVIVLTDNYRSSQAVLDTADQIIQLSSDRLVKRVPDLQKNLTAVNTPSTAGTITHLSYPSPQHQMSLVADLIKQQWDNKSQQDIAVLARNHDSLVRMASTLFSLGIPVHYERSNNVLEHPAIIEIIRLSSVIAAIHDGDEDGVNMGLSDSLRHPMWQLEPKALWDIAIANYADPHWLDYLRSSKDKHLKSISTWFETLARQAKDTPLSLMIEYLLGLRELNGFTSPVKQHFASSTHADDNYLRTLSALQQLRVLSDEFAYGARANLLDFVKLIDLHQSKGSIISDESPFVSQDKAVYLSTVHKAKGLEFDYVYLLDAVESEWKPRSSSGLSPLNLPLRPHGDDMDDYARLMFVAITRAKHSFTASSYRQDTKGEDKIASRFVQPLTSQEVTSGGVAEDVTILEQQLAWPRLELTDEKQALHNILENYSMSVTHLINFLDVTKGGPQHFFERNILHLPEAKSDVLAFGTAMHATLEEAQNITNRSEKLDLGHLQRFFLKALADQSLPIAEQKPYEAKGTDMLERLFTVFGFKLPAGSLPEQKISDVRVGNAKLNGKLDRIDITPTGLNVIDYKTGTPLTSFESRAKTSAHKIWHNRLQLIFYALLLGNNHRFNNHKHIEGQMVYLQAKSPDKLALSYVPTSDDIARVTKLVDAVWKHVMDINFPDTSGYSKDVDGICQFEEDLLAGRI